MLLRSIVAIRAVANRMQYQVGGCYARCVAAVHHLELLNIYHLIFFHGNSVALHRRLRPVLHLAFRELPVFRHNLNVFVIKLHLRLIDINSGSLSRL